MKLSAILGAVLSVVMPLTAQTIDTLGNTSVLASSGKAKTNILKVDTSVLLLNLEMHLDIPGATETLTWFLYRHNSQLGNYVLEWTKQTNATGGTGPTWYGTGPIALPLITGNHYGLGVAWAGTLTYYYMRATSGQPISFGSWYSGRTPTFPPLQTPLSIGGVDIAQYYQRLSTVPYSAVVSVGTGCGGATLQPRLVATSAATLGGTLTLEVVDAAASTQSANVIAFAPTLATPIPLFGCSFWLNLVAGPSITVVLPTSSTGLASLPIPIPNNPALTGLKLSSQSGILSGTTVSLTNALDLTL